MAERRRGGDRFEHMRESCKERERGDEEMMGGKGHTHADPDPDGTGLIMHVCPGGLCRTTQRAPRRREELPWHTETERRRVLCVPPWAG